MNRSHTIAPLLEPPPIRRAEREGAGKLVVNVVFTDPEATFAALQSARSLAENLRAVICLRAPIVVPRQLPLDRPAISLEFTENLLRKMICRLDLGAFEPSIHLYLCRDRLEVLSEVLSPGSLMVIGGRRRWWPSEGSRLAKKLLAGGYRVVFVDGQEANQWDWR